MNSSRLRKRIEKQLSEELGIPESQLELELEMSFSLTMPGLGLNLTLPSPFPDRRDDPECEGRFVVGFGKNPKEAVEELIADYRKELHRLASNEKGLLMEELHHPGKQ